MPQPQVPLPILLPRVTSGTKQTKREQVYLLRISEPKDLFKQDSLILPLSQGSPHPLDTMKPTSTGNTLFTLFPEQPRPGWAVSIGDS